MTGPDQVSSVVAGLERRSEREITILRAAYHVMARVGSNRLTLQGIADEAGVSKGLLLYHFENKGAVLQHAMEWALLQTEERIRAALDSSTGGDLLADVLDVIFVDAELNREFQLVYLDLIEAAARDEAFAELPDVVRRIVEGLYEEVVCEGVRRGELHVEDAAEAAHRMRGVIDGLLMLWLQQRAWRETHEDTRQRCLQMLRVQLGAC